MNWLGKVICDRKYIAESDLVLDIGCGMLHVGVFGRCHVGVEGFRPALEAVSDQVPTLHGLAPQVLEQFVDGSYDVVLLLDVLEHMEKAPAIQTIHEAERIARKRVVLFTPKGFVPQSAHARDGLPVNPLQEHVCGFETAEIQGYGYELTIHPNRTEQHGPCMSILGTKMIEA